MTMIDITKHEYHLSKKKQNNDILYNITEYKIFLTKNKRIHRNRYTQDMDICMTLQEKTKISNSTTEYRQIFWKKELEQFMKLQDVDRTSQRRTTIPYSTTEHGQIFLKKELERKKREMERLTGEERDIYTLAPACGRDRLALSLSSIPSLSFLLFPPSSSFPSSGRRPPLMWSRAGRGSSSEPVAEVECGVFVSYRRQHLFQVGRLSGRRARTKMPNGRASGRGRLAASGT